MEQRTTAEEVLREFEEKFWGGSKGKEIRMALDERGNMLANADAIKIFILSARKQAEDAIIVEELSGGICARDLNGPLCAECRAIRTWSAARQDQFTMRANFFKNL